MYWLIGITIILIVMLFRHITKTEVSLLKQFLTLKQALLILKEDHQEIRSSLEEIRNNRKSDNPDYNIDWDKMRALAANNQYAELLSQMNAIKEKIPDIEKRSLAWKELEETCLKNAFVETVYMDCSKLIQEKKWKEAKKLSEEAFAVMGEDLAFFAQNDKSFVTLKEECDALNQLTGGNVTGQDILDYRKKIRAKLESDKSSMNLAVVYFDLMITPLYCDLMLDMEKQEK